MTRSAETTSGENDIGSPPENIVESMDELKDRLSSMKKLMAERRGPNGDSQDIFAGKARSLNGTGLINGNFLSFVFGGALCVILSVSLYAFYNLYHAVLKRFPSKHTEL